MKFIVSCLIILFAYGCRDADQNKQKSDQEARQQSVTKTDTNLIKSDNVTSEAPLKTEIEPKSKYENARFRNVIVTRINDSTFKITGKAQIFEASLSWVVEDGHNELKAGHSTTDAGAPEWGNFNFKITVNKERPNSVLHLILFETSAKDGSRQHELPIPLV